MKTARIIAIAALAVTGWAVQAKPAPKPAGPSPAEQVTLRQAGMDMAATTLNLLKGASANGTPLKNLAFAAGGLAKWAAVSPSLFGEATRGLPSRAKPEIWTNKADFAAKNAALVDATKALAAAAAAEDSAAFASALASTGAACKGCHDSYQAPPPAKPAA